MSHSIHAHVTCSCACGMCMNVHVHVHVHVHGDLNCPFRIGGSTFLRPMVCEAHVHQ